VSSARIGVIGAGFWASYQYLPFYRDHPEVELVGAVRKDADGLDAFRREFGLEVSTTSVDELLAAGVDGVVVSSPHDLHREHAVAALEAGAHVLVEKPMTVTLRDAEAIAVAARTADRAAAVAYGWNWSRLTDWAKQMLEDGRIGRVTSVTGYMSSCLTDLFTGKSGYGVLDVGGFPVEAATETWARAEAGGGYLFGQLTHLLGLGLWLVPREPEDVFARAHLLASGVDLDIQVSVRLAGGVIGSFSGQGHEPWGRRHACDLRIAGEDGVLMLDFDRVQAQLLLEKDKERAEWLTLDADPPAAEEDAEYTCDGPAQFLVDSCLGRETVNRAPLDLGLRTVAVMEAAWQSARSGQPVSVADLDTGARTESAPGALGRVAGT
jgi:predicted dehydrogenase